MDSYYQIKHATLKNLSKEINSALGRASLGRGVGNPVFTISDASEIQFMYRLSVDAFDVYEHDDGVPTELGYEENDEGNVVPIFYCVDNDYPGVDYGDLFFFVSNDTLQDGVEYSVWRKIDQDLTWGDSGGVYVFTNVVVKEDGSEAAIQYKPTEMPDAIRQIRSKIMNDNVGDVYYAMLPLVIQEQYLEKKWFNMYDIREGDGYTVEPWNMTFYTHNFFTVTNVCLSNSDEASISAINKNNYLNLRILTKFYARPRSQGEPEQIIESKLEIPPNSSGSDFVAHSLWEFGQWGYEIVGVEFYA